MIVSTMSLKEIYAELEKDFNDIYLTQMSRFNEKFRRPALKASRYPFAMAFNYHSKLTNIDYVAVLICPSHSQFRDPMPYIYTKFSNERGTSAITLNFIPALRTTKLCIYTPHALKRYKERLLDDKDMSIDACILDIIKHNSEFVTELAADFEPYIRQDEKYFHGDNIIYYGARTKDGLFICESEKDNPLIAVFNTFVASDMLSTEQIENSFEANSMARVARLINANPTLKDHILQQIEDLYENARLEHWTRAEYMEETEKILSQYEK